MISFTEREYGLLVKDGKTNRVDVSTGNATIDRIEVYGNLQVGDKVILHANDQMKEGS